MAPAGSDAMNTLCSEFSRKGSLFLKNFAPEANAISELPLQGSLERKIYKQTWASPYSVRSFTDEKLLPPNTTIIKNRSLSKPFFKEIEKKLENALNLDLFPVSYSEFFHYGGSHFMASAGDRSNEYLLCIQLKQDLKNPWPLNVVDYYGETTSYVLKTGDAVLVRGLDFSVYSDTLNNGLSDSDSTMLYTDNSFCHRAYLSFVNADGYHLELAYTG